MIIPDSPPYQTKLRESPRSWASACLVEEYGQSLFYKLLTNKTLLLMMTKEGKKLCAMGDIIKDLEMLSLQEKEK